MLLQSKVRKELGDKILRLGDKILSLTLHQHNSPRWHLQSLQNQRRQEMEQAQTYYLLISSTRQLRLAVLETLPQTVAAWAATT